MAYDPWAATNQGLSNIGNTMMTLAQLKREDEQQVKRNSLLDLQAEAARQSVDQNKIALADAGAKQNALIDLYGTAKHSDPLASAYSFQAQQKQEGEQQKAAKEKGKHAFDEYLKVAKAVDEGLIDESQATTFYNNAMKIAGNDLDAAGVKLEFKKQKGGYYSGPVNPKSLFMINGQPAEYGAAGVVSKARVVGRDESTGLPILEMDEHTTFEQAKPKDDVETWGEPYETNVGGKRAMFQKSSRGQVRSILADNSTTVKLNVGGGSGRSSGHGGGMGITMNGLNQQQRDALTAAIGEGRLDPYKINSKNQQILADAAVANPGINLNDMAANLGLARNKDVQMKGAIAETVPPLLKSITENGKKLNYSDNQFIGMAQQWIDKRTNNPQLVKYMTLRNDQLLTLGGIMRSNGMTDMAQRLEEEAAHPTMSPRALDAWLEGQMESVEPRLKMYRSIREGKGAPREGHSSGNKLSAGASFIRDQYTAYGKAGLTEEARQQRILQKMKQRGWSKEQIGAAWLEYKGQ